MKKQKDVMIIKVAGGSQVPKVSGSIVKSVENNCTKIEMHAIGASAISQAVKSMATARGILATKGLNLSFVPGFGTTMIDGNERTMLIFKLIVE